MHAPWQNSAQASNVWHVQDRQKVESKQFTGMQQLSRQSNMQETMLVATDLLKDIGTCI